MCVLGILLVSDNHAEKNPARACLVCWGMYICVFQGAYLTVEILAAISFLLALWAWGGYRVC